MVGPDLPVVPEPAALGGGLDAGQPHRGVRALGDVAQDRAGHLVEAGQRVDDTGGVGPARVGGVDRDAAGAPALGQHRQQRHLGALAAGVRRRRLVRRRVYSGSVTGSDWVYMPPEVTITTRPSPAAELVEQQLGHEQRSEDVDGHRHLVALARSRCAPAAWRRRCARRSEMAGTAAPISAAKRRTSSRSETSHCHSSKSAAGTARRSSARAFSPFSRLRTTRCTRAPEPGQSLGGGDAEPGGGAGDDDVLAGQGVRSRVLRPRRRTTTQGVADLGVAEDDRAVQDGVEQLHRRGHFPSLSRLVCRPFSASSPSFLNAMPSTGDSTGATLPKSPLNSKAAL